MLQETIVTLAISNFECTTTSSNNNNNNTTNTTNNTSTINSGINTIPIYVLQYSNEYTKHKRSLGLLGGSVVVIVIKIELVKDIMLL